MQLDKKLKKLQERLRELKSVCVAYSGGVDSTFLLKIAFDVLEDNVLAVTAISETYPAGEIEGAKALAKKIKARHLFIRTQELKNPLFKRNPRDRCYYCKRELFSSLKNIARKEGLRFVVDGSNVDDLLDYRPGAQAKKEYSVVSPLQEAGLTKKDVRSLSKNLGLESWDKPALACLASRVPYDSRITKERLKKIDRAEELLKEKFSLRGNLRVRDYGTMALIEVDRREKIKLKNIAQVRDCLKPLKYSKVVVDPQGYRTGAMNERVHIT